MLEIANREAKDTSDVPWSKAKLLILVRRQLETLLADR